MPFMNDVHYTLFVLWEEAVASFDASGIDLDVDLELCDIVLKDSKALVFYLAGFYLNKISCLQHCCLERDLLVELVSYNSVSQAAAESASLPTSVIQTREKVSNALVRSRSEWFQFFALLETLYVVNITPANAIRYRGRLFQVLNAEIARSDVVENAWRKCVPPRWLESEDEVVNDVFDSLVQRVLLPSYGNLKGGDTLRSLKKRNRQTLEDLSLRTYVRAVENRPAKRNTPDT